MSKKFYFALLYSLLLTSGFNSLSLFTNAQTISPTSNDEENNLLVFVGEKIEVKGFSPELKKNEILMDFAYKARYKIVQTIYGKYDKATIEFEAYDHYGYPHFANYKNVLLFVSKGENGQYYHQKYQYFDVYKTINGKWASCGDPYKFDDYYRKDIKAVELKFDKTLIFDIDKELPQDNDEYVKKIFTEPFFKVRGNKAECLMGADSEDLFIVKKGGELKDRGLFK